MAVKGSRSVQLCAAFSQEALCVKSIIHLVTVSSTPGGLVFMHMVASSEALGEICLLKLILQSLKPMV